MARIEALELLLDPSGKMYLKELYDGVIANVQKGTISGRIKNTELSGNPESGTVEAKRFKNANSQAYGTARSAGGGNDPMGKTVTIPIDQNREFVEEIEKKDVSLLGVDGLLQKRAANHTLRMEAELDKAFFQTAFAEGLYLVPTESDVEKILEEAILTLETTQTGYVDGVPRDMMSLTLSPEYYSKIRNKLDAINNTGITTQDEEFYRFHGVRCWSSNRLPAGCHFEIMVDGSVAQPVMAKQYNAEKIPLSEAYALELFYYYGTKAVTPELIISYATATGVTISSAAGTSSGKTKVTVSAGTAGTGESYVYKTAASVDMPLVGADLSAWTDWNGSAEIAATSTHAIVVAVVDSNDICIRAGKATVTSAT